MALKMVDGKLVSVDEATPEEVKAASLSVEVNTTQLNDSTPEIITEVPYVPTVNNAIKLRMIHDVLKVTMDTQQLGKSLAEISKILDL